MPGKFISIETHSSAPIPAGGTRLSPAAWSLRVWLPGGLGGLVWNRPWAVTVQRDGQEQTLRVPDSTRQLQLALLAAGLAGSLLIWYIASRDTGPEPDEE